jgi:predicted ferric reductase
MGWWVVWSVALLGAILWWTTSWSSLGDQNWQVWSRAIGQLSGVIGLGWFAFTFVLETRWQWTEEIFGGLNKVYSAHHWLGGMSFILLLVHPISLGLSRLHTSWGYALDLFNPTISWWLTLGQLSLVVMQVVLIATFFWRMMYHNWKFLHQWIGLGFGLGVIHGVWQGFGLRGWSWLTAYELLALLVMILAYGYRTLFRRWLVKTYAYQVVKINKMNSRVMDIEMSPTGEVVRYRPGQFVFVKFPTVLSEWHPFSITSDSGNIRLGIKALGDFTQRLLAKLEVGVAVAIERPYGKFFERNFPQYNMVWVAGGIGITPFVGMAKSLTDAMGETQLIFSMARDNDLVYSDELDLVAREHLNFRWERWVSEVKGRLGTTDILKNVDIAKTEFYICGPTGMMVGLTKELIRAGAKRSQVHTEMFAL